MTSSISSLMRGAAVGVGILCVVGVGRANATVYSSFAVEISPSSLTAYSGSSVQTNIGTSTTSFVFGAYTSSVGTIASSYLGHPNQLTNLTFGDPLTLSGTNPATTAYNTFNITSLGVIVNISGSPLYVAADGYTFEFTQQEVSNIVNDTLLNAGSISLEFVGQLITDTSGGVTASLPQIANLQMTFSQAANGGALSVSSTLNTPSPLPVPEPSSFALLVTGLLGLGFFRFKRS